jgi:hypothetical protein
MNTQLIADIARVTHEANRALCITIGDDSQKPWDEAEEWQRESAIAGVLYALENPDVTPIEQHEAWQRHKKADGWKYGPTKNADLKEHPCLVPYDQLPPEQQKKDALFRAVVLSLKP